jgi:hypothetical protein
MNYYFMPRVEGLESVVSLANFPCVDGMVEWPGDEIIHVAWSDGKNWQFRDIGTVGSGLTCTLTGANLPADCPSDVTGFWFLASEKMPRLGDRLYTDNRKTVPNWRGNIGFRSKTTAASYQGEYPQEMLGIATGTLLSYASFAQSSPGVHTKMVLANMSHNPARDTAVVKFLRARDGAVLGEGAALFNHCSVIDVPNVEPGEMIVAVSDGITGIPLFLIHDDGFTEMNFEHTHAPTGLLLFGRRQPIQRSAKAWWIGRSKK